MVMINIPMPKSCDKCRFMHNYITFTGNHCNSCVINGMLLSGVSIKDNRARTCPLTDFGPYEDDLK